MIFVEEVPQPHDAHVVLANETFRSAGFTLAAMQFPRSPEAIQALRDYNRIPDQVKIPFAWNYHPNAYCKAFWETNRRLA